MANFVLVHGAGDAGWSWHLVEAELKARGHRAVAPDLPCDDDTASLDDYVAAVTEAAAGRRELVIVGHSYGGYTATLAAHRLPARLLVLLAAMIPAPGETPDSWWGDSGYRQAAARQAELDGGAPGDDDPFGTFYDGVPRPLAEEALRRGNRGESSVVWITPWPLRSWPDVPTRFVLCRDDRFFPAAFMRRHAQERLGTVADELPGCHCVALQHPKALTDLLLSYLDHP